MAEEEALTKVRWVYVGRRLNQEHKISYWWLTVREDGTYDPDQVHIFDKRIEQTSMPMMPKPGAVFDVNTTQGGNSVKIGGAVAPQYVTMLDDSATCAEWEAREAADLIRHKANKRMREEMSEDTLRQSLLPLLNAMRKTNHQGRLAIKLVVLEYLDKHGG